MILYIPICIYTYVLHGSYEQLWWAITVIFISIQYRAVWESVPVLDNTQAYIIVQNQLKMCKCYEILMSSKATKELSTAQNSDYLIVCLHSLHSTCDDIIV